MPEDAYGRSFTIPGPYTTVESIKRANRESGYHFFDADSMRFFRSRIAPGVIAGRLFVTSEQFVTFDGKVEPRRYTVRVAHDDGQIEEVGTFQEFPTLRAARQTAERFAAGQPVSPSLP